MLKLLPMLEQSQIVERYSWFSADGESELFADTNTWKLTPLGETYRNIGGAGRRDREQGDRLATAPR